MRRTSLKWSLALVLSGALHAGAAAVLAPGEEHVQVEGGASLELAMLGNTFADQVSAGDASETVDAVEAEISEPEAPSATEAVRPDTTTESPQRQAEPAMPESTDTPPVESATAARPAMTEPEQAARQSPAAPNTEAMEVETADAKTSEMVEEIDPAAQSVIAALTPPMQQDATKPVEASPVVPDTIVPLEETTEVAALVKVPLPTPRPDYTPAAMPRAQAPAAQPRRQEDKPRTTPPQQRKAQPPPAPGKSGSGGQNEVDARKGTAQGSSQGSVATQGNRGSSQVGNAAVSNYPGKISSKIRRALRYPSAARRDRLRGEVHVAFSVSRSGGLGSVRVARSSGSNILDQAAIETVRRAAPFPPIPDGRASWPFTIPLSFTR